MTLGTRLSNLTLIICIGYHGVASGLAFFEGGLLPDLIVCLTLGMVCGRVWSRGSAAQVRASVTSILLVAGSFLLPILYAQLPGTGQQKQATQWLTVLVSLGMGWSAVSLGSNFSVLPARRSLVTIGPYRIVRHPLYASYLLFDFLVHVLPGTWHAWLVWLGEAGLLTGRALLEERCLKSDPLYAVYCRRVPFRLIPGLF